MKAWQVTADDAEASEIVFADTAAQAKVEAHGGDWLSWFDYTDLRATRLPLADDAFIDFGPGLVPYSPKAARLMWSLGWHQIDGDECQECGAYQFDDVPESKLNDDGLCSECAAEEAERHEQQESTT